MAVIGSPPIEDIWDRHAVALEQIAVLRRQVRELEADREQYRSEANRLRRKAS